ncbi:MAG: endonuclease/exonuclease/phosphatase family protein [Caldilineaceae bacterium]
MTFIRIMTLNNFNTTPAADIEHVSDVWANRAAFNVKTIKRYEPDLIGFQEFEPEHWATYQHEFTDYQTILPTEYGEGTAIFWKAERFALLDHGFVGLLAQELPHLTDLEDDALLSTTWVKLRCQQSGLAFIYLNTHLNDASEGANWAGHERNLQKLADLDHAGTLPILMGGDFNCNPWSSVYRSLLKAGFVDTYRAAGHADSVEASTFHGFRGVNYFALEWGGSVFWRVDWIMARAGEEPLQTLSCTIVRDAEPPVFVSDHYPVVTELLIGE